MSDIGGGRREREFPAAPDGAIAVRIREVRQLFDSMDPSPFREQDLEPHAEEYIIDSVRELPSETPTELLLYLDRPTGLLDEARVIGEAIRAHFARRATLMQRDLQRLLRRGLISLSIGLTFLTLLFGLARLVEWIMGNGTFASLLKESLVIGGWVAMWRPLEIFLYDWWPILGEQRIHDRLSRVTVRVMSGSPQPQDELRRMLASNDRTSGTEGAVPGERLREFDSDKQDQR